MSDNLIQLFKATRLAKNISQADIADKIHISPKAWSKIETGQNVLKFEYVKPICELLDIPYVQALQIINPIFKPTETSLKEAGELSKTGELLSICQDGTKEPITNIPMHHLGRTEFTPEEYAMFCLLADYFEFDPEDEYFIGIFILMIQHRDFAWAYQDRHVI